VFRGPRSRARKAILSELRKDSATRRRGINFDGAIVYPDAFGASGEPAARTAGSTAGMIRSISNSARIIRPGSRPEARHGSTAMNIRNAEKLCERLYITPAEESQSGIRTVALTSPASPDDGDSVALPVSLLPPLPLNLTAVAERIKKGNERGAVFRSLSKYKNGSTTFSKKKHPVGADARRRLQGGSRWATASCLYSPIRKCSAGNSRRSPRASANRGEASDNRARKTYRRRLRRAQLTTASASTTG